MKKITPIMIKDSSGKITAKKEALTNPRLQPPQLAIPEQVEARSEADQSRQRQQREQKQQTPGLSE